MTNEITYLKIRIHNKVSLKPFQRYPKGTSYRRLQGAGTASLPAEGRLLPFARGEFQNSPVDCFERGRHRRLVPLADALAESVP